MRRNITIRLLCIAAVGLLIPLGRTMPLAAGADGPTLRAVEEELSPQGGRGERIVVANRASGSISVIDVKTDAVLGTLPLPAGPNPPEPMYVVGVRGDRVLVGDRANDRLVVFDAETFLVLATIPAGAGVFHMWADQEGQQLWVNDDRDKTATVIDSTSLGVLATVPMPADLVALGGIPHDVVLDHQNAYVTMIGVSGPSDYVVKFSQGSFVAVGRAAVGKDPHLSLSLRNRRLYVPCQGSSTVFVLDRDTLQTIAAVPVPGAHGAGMAMDGKTFYTTNLPGGGPKGLFAVDTRTNTIIGQPLDTPRPVPHNIALTSDDRKLYLTHSGPSSNSVTIYAIDPNTRLPILRREVTVGLNPFGIALIR